VSELSRERQISALQVESELLYMRKHFGADGLALHLALVVLGDAILAFKDLVKARGIRLALRRFEQTRISGRLAWRTRLGTRPTR
jgi:hypothetical protein